MKTCPNCHTQLDDNAAFCTNCGMPFSSSPGDAPQYAPPAYTAPTAPLYDHTAEFDPKDISNNKVYAMVPYLLGSIGIIIALLAASGSKYVEFHIRQVIKMTVASILMWIAAMLLCWTIIAPVAALIMSVVLGVIKIICFFQICSGKAVEPAIVRSLPFLK